MAANWRGEVSNSVADGASSEAFRAAVALEAAAELDQPGHQCVGDALRAAPSEGPTVRVRAGEQQHPERRRQRAPKRQHRVRRASGEERAGFVGRESASQDRGRQQGVDAEAREENRMMRHVHDRPQHIFGEIVETTGQATDDRSVGLAIFAQRRHRRVEIGLRHCASTAVERMGKRCVRVDPLESQALEWLGPEERRRHAENVHGRTHVVDDVRLDQRLRAGPTAGCVRGLEYEHRSTRLCEGHCSGQTIGAGAHDHCVEIGRHASAFSWLADR